MPTTVVKANILRWLFNTCTVRFLPVFRSKRAAKGENRKGGDAEEAECWCWGAGFPGNNVVAFWVDLSRLRFLPSAFSVLRKYPPTRLHHRRHSAADDGSLLINIVSLFFSLPCFLGFRNQEEKEGAVLALSHEKAFSFVRLFWVFGDRAESVTVRSTIVHDLRRRRHTSQAHSGRHRFLPDVKKKREKSLGNPNAMLMLTLLGQIFRCFRF